jgi:penicillin-binding protein 1A
MSNKNSTFLQNFFVGLASISLTAIILFSLFIFYLILSLPNVSQLKDIHLQVPLRIYTADNKLMAEFGSKRRTPVTIDQVPKPLVRAIIDTEDQRFYEHQGVDFIGLVRAVKNLFTTGKKSEGASTITMQVARDFFLTPEKTYSRKMKEIILAFKIDHKFNKNSILELYLNKVYFGQRAYGVAAAAETYYGKSLNQLTLPEMAMIAGLPQAPSRNNPLSNQKAALERRNHVLKRMYEVGDINKAEYEAAVRTPSTENYHAQASEIEAPYAAEMVRQDIINKYGDSIYDEGVKVYTTIDSRMQINANNSLRNGILAYTRRHGAVYAEGNLDKFSKHHWQSHLRKIRPIDGLYPAAVTEVTSPEIKLLMPLGNEVSVTDSAAANKLQVGDVVRVQFIDGQWKLTPLPTVNGALVSLSPKDGAILALVGGFSYSQSNFNCATQADRQPGSSLKPFIYSAALEKNFTLASIINDAPIVIDDYGNGLWRPQNFTHQFAGPTRLRVALIESRNLVSIRLLQAIGIPYAISYLERFGFDPKELPPTPSLALGTANISPIELTAGYAVFANGGYKIQPFLIDRVVDSSNKVLFKANPVAVQTENSNLKDEAKAPQVITPQNAYLLTDVMKDIVKRDAAALGLHVNRADLAGKTGTTNQQMDAWFAGFNRNLVTTVWVGYNIPKALDEYGAQAAFPIWLDYTQNALQGTPESLLPEPPGIVSVRIDPATGLLANPNQKDAIFELFFEDNAPTKQTSAKAAAQPAASSNTSNATDDNTAPQNDEKNTDDSATDNSYELF